MIINSDIVESYSIVQCVCEVFDNLDEDLDEWIFKYGEDNLETKVGYKFFSVGTRTDQYNCFWKENEHMCGADALFKRLETAITSIAEDYFLINDDREYSYLFLLKETFYTGIDFDADSWCDYKFIKQIKIEDLL